MAALRFETPDNWIQIFKCISPSILEELRRRCRPEYVQTYLAELNELDTLIKSAPHWYDEIFYVRVLRGCLLRTDDYFETLARILCQALQVPRDCYRKLEHGQQHNLTFFTNFRAIQVYCCHTAFEAAHVRKLVRKSIDFYLRQVKGETYHECTDPLFHRTRPFLAWECIYPEGIDMEALSPRDANVHKRLKTQVAMKPKAPPAKIGKEKDHPPPPPTEVREPPSSDRQDGAVYQTGKLLGRGGFAICYEGQLVQPATKQIYALKIVKSHMPQKKMENKFQTELQIHSKMNHANIVQFHRAFSYQAATYIVLELCPNGSLMDMVKKRKFITEPEVRFWTVQMTGAVKYMHAKGIIHRDLKMGNIFLDKDMNIKIGDFGLAALLMSGKDLQILRRTTLCGTPNYIAPEILSKDKGGHDHTVDIWALGIIIYAMLTGKPPFQSTTADEIYRRAREREYDWPQLDTSENFISDEVKDLVTELLQSPEDRPDPDTIVQHPFFTSGYVPQTEEMLPSLRERHPEPSQFLSVGIRGSKSAAITRNLKKLCVSCSVGPWSEKKRHASVYREVSDEEKAGFTPKVPLAADVVYRPFRKWLHEQANEGMGNRESTVQAVEAMDKPALPAPKSLNPEQAGVIRPATQSFAAQQRVRPEVSTVRSRKPVGGSASSKPIINTSNRNISRKVEPKVTKVASDVQDRLAADMVQNLPAAGENKKERKKEVLTFSLENLTRPLSLFGPKDVLDPIPDTTPDIIFDRIRRFHAEVDRALNSRSMAIEPKVTPPAPSIVIKWVDYTNKVGLGYILSNGSVGALFQAFPAFIDYPEVGYLPPTCFVVRNGEHHMINMDVKDYIDRNEIIPLHGANVEFYESRGSSGIFRGTVDPHTYKIEYCNEGKKKLAVAVNQWDHAKKTRAWFYKKFSEYMVEHGRDSDFPYDDALTRNLENQSPAVAAGNVVTFFQRFGDVGCWGFCDGHFQFNFPDHTKIVISADGTWCDFYHLPLEAAHLLAETGTISPSALDDRQHLSYPLQTLLNFMAKPSKVSKAANRKRPEISPMIQGIPQANDFRRKIEFVRSVFSEWVSNGGLGISDMSITGRLRWDGHREKVNVQVPYKHVWSAVGGQGDQGRKVAWFNPNRPHEIMPDIKG